jgi:hypothetical protein
MARFSNAATLFWLLSLGYLGLYAYCVVIGFFSPGEVVALGVVALVLAVGSVWHAIRVTRTMRDHDAPGHDAMMRALHHQRELRGF